MYSNPIWASQHTSKHETRWVMAPSTRSERMKGEIDDPQVSSTWCFRHTPRIPPRLIGCSIRSLFLASAQLPARMGTIPSHPGLHSYIYSKITLAKKERILKRVDRGVNWIESRPRPFISSCGGGRDLPKLSLLNLNERRERDQGVERWGRGCVVVVWDGTWMKYRLLLSTFLYSQESIYMISYSRGRRSYAEVTLGLRNKVDPSCSSIFDDLCRISIFVEDISILH